jgi:Protein of unknown function (DUF1571)
MHRLHLGIVGVGLVGVAWTLAVSGVIGQTAPQVPPGQPSAQPSAAAPLDQAIAWMQEAKRNYSAVKDYTCTLISRENIRGRLKDENIIQMKFRAAPFSVYMRWLGPPDLQNQEVAYVAGQNNNQMRVHSKGILKIAGFVSVDVKDPRVMEHSRHTILEAGMGNLIDQTLINWNNERKIGRSEVRLAEYEYDKRPCLRIENTRPERIPGLYAYRSVIYLDKVSKLPIRNESYDWPRQGGNPAGDLLESYSYVNLQFNVGLTDRDFAK